MLVRLVWPVVAVPRDSLHVPGTGRKIRGHLLELVHRAAGIQEGRDQFPRLAVGAIAQVGPGRGAAVLDNRRHGWVGRPNTHLPLAPRRRVVRRRCRILRRGIQPIRKLLGLKLVRHTGRLCRLRRNCLQGVFIVYRFTFIVYRFTFRPGIVRQIPDDSGRFRTRRPFVGNLRRIREPAARGLLPLVLGPGQDAEVLPSVGGVPPDQPGPRESVQPLLHVLIGHAVAQWKAGPAHHAGAAMKAPEIVALQEQAVEQNLLGFRQALNGGRCQHALM